ncbi:hypothetical protein [Rhodoferax sp.]|uniref:hypothetical protein n=1 Tax=Rhodoferax sp. TaxID=50421 RepID=UPI002779E3B2|nr:hypothetical protein [Rhodoferax sp.]
MLNMLKVLNLQNVSTLSTLIFSWGFSGLRSLNLGSKKTEKPHLLIDGFIDGNKNKTPRRAHVY